MTGLSPWMTIKEAAPRLGVHPDTLRRWCRLGISPAPQIAVRWGMTGWRISRVAVERLERGELVAS